MNDQQPNDKPKYDNSPEAHIRRAELVTMLGTLTTKQLDLMEKLIFAATEVHLSGGTDEQVMEAINEAFKHKDKPKKYNLFSDDVTDLDRRTWAAMGHLIGNGGIPAPNIEAVWENEQSFEAIQQLRDQFWHIRDTLKLVYYLETGERIDE